MHTNLQRTISFRTMDCNLQIHAEHVTAPNSHGLRALTSIERLLGPWLSVSSSR